MKFAEELQVRLQSFLGNNPPLALITCIAALIIAHAIGTIIYNLYFHPLSAYPGPRSAACTNLACWRAAVSGDLLPWIRAAHEKYGETVRLGPNTLSYTNPQAWKDIYGQQKRTNPKDTLYYPPHLNGRHALNALPSDADHARLRRVFAPAFSASALRAQTPQIVTPFADLLVRNMRKLTTSKRLDLVTLLTCTTMDIISDLTFGAPLGLLATSDDQQAAYTPWVAAIFGWLKAADLSRIGIEYPWLGALAKALTPPALTRAARMHFGEAAARVDERVARGAGERPDLWGYVLREQQQHGKEEEEEVMDMEDMYANATIFMLAGSETSATLLSGLVWLLCRNPEKMAALCAELRGQEGDVEALPRMKYLAACIDEAMRLYPPLPIGPPREVHRDGNIICGKWVPGKTRVSVAQYTAYRSPLYFKDPEAFIPERWLPGTGYDHDRRDVVQPFSYGPRNCIGKPLAYQEIRIILAKILWNFDLKLCPESDGWINQKSYSMWKKDPLWVEATPIR
ncbi:Cytochrome p450 protein [Lasiodiplodia theobromae]|uniref:Cytochrome p450 protein n=1 Tax=Lasiodiplodia theobromae TaxID=45133 RepID=UPI0015C30646|nr:Cytochrome p450 protein [Lasiodiplodia theobromae]KAF4546144.1 Cytochrome p450 protein [Lasiodiplodia theobromae]